MRTDNFRRARVAFGSAILVLSATAAVAQVPNASPAATGLSGAYTARARGYDAVAWNPANLGLPGNPAFSFTAAAINGSSGLDPISLGDVAPYSGKDLPASQRETWLQKITTAGGENGRLDGGVTYLGMSAGPVAFQVSTSIAGSTKLSPDAFEALMFGNAGRTGQVKNLNFSGSNVHLGAFSTAAMSYGVYVGGDAKTGSRASFGVTGKYVLGNMVAMAQDQGTTTSADAVNVNFPIVYSNPDSTKVAGKGFGMDVGFAWTRKTTTFGITVQNVFNTFAWDETKLLSKQGTALFNGGDNNDTHFNDTSYALAPASLRQQITDDKFKPIIAAGLAVAVRPSVVFSADVRQQLGDVLLVGPKTTVGAGIDYRWLPVLRLRGGASYLTGGWGASGGLGFEIGHYELGLGVSMQNVNGGKQPGVTLNVLSIH